MGRPLNPTPASAPSFDIKSFNELRPGMILWWVLDISCLCEQSIRLGGLHKVTASMWLVLLMHGIYIVDALYNEVSKTEMRFFTASSLSTFIDVCFDNHGHHNRRFRLYAFVR